MVLRSDAGVWSLWASQPVADLPGWVVVLGFKTSDGLVELVNHTVTWVDRFMDVAEFERVWLPGWSERNPLPDSWAVGGITTRLVRSIVKGDLERRARAEIARHAVGSLLPAGLVQTTVKRVDGVSEIALARLAAAYVELCQSMEPKPVARLADELHMKRGTVSHKLFLARDRGLLTSTGPGRAGGLLTARARQLLEKED